MSIRFKLGRATTDGWRTGMPGVLIASISKSTMQACYPWWNGTKVMIFRLLTFKLVHGRTLYEPEASQRIPGRTMNKASSIRKIFFASGPSVEFTRLHHDQNNPSITAVAALSSKAIDLSRKALYNPVLRRYGIRRLKNVSCTTEVLHDKGWRKKDPTRYILLLRK